MDETINTSWCDITFNPWNCSRNSPERDRCCAEIDTAARAHHILWRHDKMCTCGVVADWQLPLYWNSVHTEFFAQHGRRRRVFCALLDDVFDYRADPYRRAELWALIQHTPQLDWLMLTKHIGNAVDMLPFHRGEGNLHVGLGISVATQEEIDRDVPRLLTAPAQLRWLSIDPLLESVSLTNMLAKSHSMLALDGSRTSIDWVVCGGESGTGGWPMPAGAVHSLRAECAAAGIPFSLRQWGGTAEDKEGGFAQNEVWLKAA